MRAVLAALTACCLGAAEGTVAVDLSGTLPLRPVPAFLAAEESSLHDVTVHLRKALAADEGVVVLDLSSGFAAGPAAAEALVAVIRAARADGSLEDRRLIALVDGIDDPGLVVAAACDEVVMCDAGLLLIDGLGFESYYLADALAKIGVRFRAVASGEHKTAHEPFTRNGPSPAGLAELDELAHGLDRAVRDLSVREGTDLVKIRARAPQTPAIAAELGLVDVVAERGAWLADLPEPVRWVGSEEVGSRDLSGMAGLLEVWSQLLKTAEHPHHPQAVAVVELEGEIVDGAWSDPGSTIAGDDTADLMDDLAGDERIKAVVLRINSPGGAAGASDRIHHAVRRLSGAKPVVALFDQYAASGGYYIGCAADEILAHRTTVTGSIGVFALVPDASAALDLLGVRRVSVTTAPRAEVFSVTAPFTPDREAAIAQVIADVDQRFQGLVAERRKLTARRTQELAGGRVFTGDQAVANGLADGIGSLADAVSAARKRAGIDAKLPLERYPRPQGLFQRLGFATGTQIAADLLPPALRAQLALLPRLATGRPLIQARGLVPFEMR